MSSSVERGAEVLGRFLRRSGSDEPVAFETRLIEEAPEDGRRVVEYVAGDRRFVGKFFGDNSGQTTYDVMRAVRDALDRAPGGSLLAVPDALFYDPELRFLAQEYVAGDSFVELARLPGEERTLRLAGEALSILHAQPLTLGCEKRMADHVRELIRPHPSRLAGRHPEYAPLIESALAQLARTDPCLDSGVPAAPIHRDFHLRQLFHGRGRVWLIDWDLFARGDAAFDVAYFLVYLDTHLPAGIVEAAQEAFLAGYLVRGDRSVLERIRPYTAFNYLRRACRRFRLKDANWEIEMRRMFVRLESCTTS